jgi:NADH-quinone oxidoreductase subunit H
VAGLVVLALFIALASAACIAVDHVRTSWAVFGFIGEHAVLNALVKSFIIAVFVTVHVLLLIWWERKFAGWMQARLGPKHVGWNGLAQTVADAMKLLLKEDIIPSKADPGLFVVAPFLVFMPTLLTFMVLPFSATWVGLDYGVALLLALAVSTNVSLGILAAGWGANNKYSLLGGARACAQVLAYEIPLGISILSVVVIAGSLSMVDIVNGQAGLWNIVAHAPVLVPAFVIFLICVLAELNRTPFDLPEAESELVSGFHTEYSGMRFAFFYLAEFANNFFMAGLAVTLFFGGWHGPLLPGPVWFAIKTVVVVTLIMWIRWTVPRFRVDQMMGFCWKVLVPLSLVVFCAAALWGMWLQP